MSRKLLDISKAFDSIYWAFLIEVLSHLGFGPNWCNLISYLLASSSTQVLLNGSPGNLISHRRGLRQGDPLSPMLFILIMMSSAVYFCWLKIGGCFRVCREKMFGTDFPAMLMMWSFLFSLLRKIWIVLKWSWIVLAQFLVGYLICIRVVPFR